MENNQAADLVKVNENFELGRLRKTATELLVEVNDLGIPFSISFHPKTSLNSAVRRFEQHVIEFALDQSNRNQVEAAKLLNLNYSTLNAKIRRFGIVDNAARSTNLLARKSPSEILEMDSPAEKDANGFRHHHRESPVSSRLRLIKSAITQLIEKIDSLGFAATMSAFDKINLADEMRQFETHLIRTALDRTGGNQSRAAKLLTVSGTTLNNKIKRFKIQTSKPFQEKASQEIWRKRGHSLGGQ